MNKKIIPQGKKLIMKVPAKNKTYVGYCSNESHKGYVTVEIIKQHKCDTRQCRFFKKFEEHQYWNSNSWNNMHKLNHHQSMIMKQLTKLLAGSALLIRKKDYFQICKDCNWDIEVIKESLNLTERIDA